MPESKVLLILGSLRAGSNTAKVGALAKASLEAHGFNADVIDPQTTELAFPGLAEHDGCAKPLQKRAQTAIGAVFVTPEYDGSFSSILKLTIEHFGYPSALAGKPVVLLGCAGGRIGAVKALEHLRSMLSHTGAIVLPLSFSIPEVHRAFDHQGQLLDPQVEQGIEAVIAAFHGFVDRV